MIMVMIFATQDKWKDFVRITHLLVIHFVELLTNNKYHSGKGTVSSPKHFHDAICTEWERDRWISILPSRTYASYN